MKKINKQKNGSACKLLAITLPFVCLSLAISIAVPVVANNYSQILDTYIGGGEVKIDGENVSYYDIKSKTASEAHLGARDLTQRIAEEGIVMLKNNGALPLDTSANEKKVTLLGRRSVDSVYGGTGSGSINAELAVDIPTALSNAGFQINEKTVNLYKNNLDNVSKAKSAMDNPSGCTYYIGEFPQSYYTDEIVSSYKDYNGAAIVVIGRQGGEGFDFSPDLKGSLEEGVSAMSSSVEETSNYQDGQHQLELSKEERDLIKHAKENFDKVVVVINSANVMEIGSLEEEKTSSNLGVDAILWAPAPGTTGMNALGEILNGSVNPSGRTVDTWINDLTKEPSFNNYVSAKYSNIDSKDTADKKDAYFMDYEEGIYVGYRYYETAYAEASAGNYSGFDYDSLVTYPFGYGLSYTTFDWEVEEENVSTVDEKGEISFKVKVTNSGTKAGKDVLEIYYTPAMADDGVERAEKNLVAFDKTKLLEPGESEELTLSFSVEDMASYDYKHSNSNGSKGCYKLASGDYKICLQTDSHTIKEGLTSYTYKQDEEVLYEGDNPRQSEIDAQKGATRNISEEAKASLVVKPASNQFEYLNEHFREYDEESSATAVNFSRKDFLSSYPSAPTASDCIASDSVKKDFEAYSPDYYDSSDKAPTTGAKNGVNFIEVRGKAFDDPLWDKLLDEMSVGEMSNLVMNGQYGTVKISSINKVPTVDLDGPAGITLYGALSPDNSNNGYCCGTMLGATWNEELSKEFGESIGEEAAWYKNGNRKVLNSWYAPGLNMHRTAFSGRNFEYYSEDPLLSGIICKATIEGASSKGVNAYIKHFVLNDQDMNRTGNGLAAWVNEQAFREIYLKAFEIVVKDATNELKYLDASGKMVTKNIRSCRGLMSTYTRIGSKNDASSKELNYLLRDEWGFLGTVVTDSNISQHTHVEDCMANLSDLQLTTASISTTKITDTSNPSTMLKLRKACKNIIYTTVHSNAANGLSPNSTVSVGASTWVIYVALVSALFGAISLGLITFDVVKIIKMKKKKIDQESL